MDFSCVLLREKFVIRDASTTNPEDTLVAVSNRLSITLHDGSGKISEIFVVRSQSMHICTRMAAKIIRTFQDLGPLMSRDFKFDFDAAWNDITEEYERQYNENCWLSVYNKGRRIFKSNDYHAFLDIIENCDAKNTSTNYETSVMLAEEIFAQSGKKITIDYDGHTGLVIDIRKARARCSMILRSPLRRTNFNYTATLKADGVEEINIPQCLTVAAAFLEGVQLAFFIGRVNEYQRLDNKLNTQEDLRIARAARLRVQRLEGDIRNFEVRFNVTYRPERPEFPHITIESEKYFHRIDIEEKRLEALSVS